MTPGRSHNSLRKTGAVVALALVCAVVLVGCAARQSDGQYQERLEQALAIRIEVTNRLEREEFDDRAAYEAAAEQVRTALDELDADPPPRGIQQGHERMIAALEGLSTLLVRLGRCEALGERSEQDGRACRQSIGQDVYDEIRNDFGEADTIYREEGFTLPGLGGGTDEGDGADGGDTLDGEDAAGKDEL